MNLSSDFDLRGGIFDHLREDMGARDAILMNGGGTQHSDRHFRVRAKEGEDGVANKGIFAERALGSK